MTRKVACRTDLGGIKLVRPWTVLRGIEAKGWSSRVSPRLFHC